MHDIEIMRASEGLPSSLVTYFINDSLNGNAILSACMEGIAEQVSSDSAQVYSSSRPLGDKRLPSGPDRQGFPTGPSETTF